MLAHRIPSGAGVGSGLCLGEMFAICNKHSIQRDEKRYTRSERRKMEARDKHCERESHRKDERAGELETESRIVKTLCVSKVPFWHDTAEAIIH